MTRRELMIVTILAVIGALLLTRGLFTRPTFTDSYYHFNAAVRLAAGEGLTDAYIWTYVGQPQPDSSPVLETPSHLYWMPFTSIAAGAGMWLFNAPGDFHAAQLPLTLMFAGTVVVGYWLGFKLGGGRRTALVAALLTLFSGFFVNFWGEIDTFAAYAFAGSLSLALLGLGLERGDWRWFFPAGILAGIGHLTRSDGLLLILVGWLTIIWWMIRGSGRARQASSLRTGDVSQEAITFANEHEPGSHTEDSEHSQTVKSSSPVGEGFGVRAIILLTAGYLLVMMPWFLRMNAIVGAPLPLGGLQAAWLTEYNDLFRFPPDASAGEFFADGLGPFLETRWRGFINNVQTFIAVEGLVVMTPLMLIGLWRRRGWFVLPMAVFALGIHAAMTLVFPLPGLQGGLFHGVVALVPWWAALGIAGLDASIDWIASRRKRWQPGTARVVFSIGLGLLAIALTLVVLRPNRPSGTPSLYRALSDALPEDSRILSADPATVYYFTGMGGAVLPNEDPAIIPEIAARYGLTHILLERVVEEDGAVVFAAVPSALMPLVSDPPDFLTPVTLDHAGSRLYMIQP